MAHGLRRCTWSISNENRIGLVNRSGVSIHHVVDHARFCPVAFILDERATGMVNRGLTAHLRHARQTVPA
ncbi:hypothetical protein [Bradyrhizobium genosp. P]|uniref:hypothetical protein n=1 Tax=Bradyrhizobium genosp. P TaxID=83641 RepID=UPI003CF1FE34